MKNKQTKQKNWNLTKYNLKQHRYLKLFNQKSLRIDNFDNIFLKQLIDYLEIRPRAHSQRSYIVYSASYYGLYGSVQKKIHLPIPRPCPFSPSVCPKVFRSVNKFLTNLALSFSFSFFRHVLPRSMLQKAPYIRSKTEIHTEKEQQTDALLTDHSTERHAAESDRKSVTMGRFGPLPQSKVFNDAIGPKIRSMTQF